MNEAAAKDPKLAEYFKKPMNQDGAGWCYAYAATLMRAIKTGEVASSIHLSIEYNKWRNTEAQGLAAWYHRSTRNPRELSEGGGLRNALELFQRRPICTEEAMPSDLNIDLPNKKQWAFTFVATHLQHLNDPNPEQTRAVCDIIANPLSQIFRRLSVPEIRGILLRHKDKTADEIFEELSLYSCGSRRLYYPRQLASEKILRPSSTQEPPLTEKINELIARGEPLGIVYYPGKLMRNPPSGAEEHTSVAIAREMVDGKCYTVIRNSWGNDGCGVMDRHGLICRQDGTFLAPDELLNEAIKDVTFFTN